MVCGATWVLCFSAVMELSPSVWANTSDAPFLLPCKVSPELVFYDDKIIPNYAKDVIDFPTNNKASHRGIIKLQVVALVNVTI